MSIQYSEPIGDLNCTCLTQRQRRVLLNALGRAWLESDRVARESEALREEYSKDKEDYTEIRGKVEKIPICK